MSESILEAKAQDMDDMAEENRFSWKRKTMMGFRKMRQKKTAHHPVGQHIQTLFDEGRFTEEFAPELETDDPLHFPGYQKKLEENRRTSENLQGCIAGVGRIHGIAAVGAELSKNFMMGSMGSAEGEKLTIAIEEADQRKLPLIIFSASGGARMQEGMVSLMQMAKTSAAVERLRKHGGLYISVLTHPTTGGVSASYASLGDIVLAEPGALIGFAGPRVIEQTIGEKLPKGFQRSEFQLEHGFVDEIVPIQEQKERITKILKLHGYPAESLDSDSVRESSSIDLKAAEDSAFSGAGSLSVVDEDQPEREGSLSAYERVLLVRDKCRPKITDYIRGIFDDFLELCGDRIGKEDPAVFGGIGLLNGKPVTVIGHRKGTDLTENMNCNFGMPEPQGYRKALRLMKEAEKFGRPIVTFIDTPGAYPGKEAEENGQSAAIAENLAAMSDLMVPVICIVTGEGNSGGALAIGVGDEIWMLENAVYSVLSPEGFASILWKDASQSRKASEVMKMTAQDLLELGIADRVIPEPEGGAQKDLDQMCRILKDNLEVELTKLEEEDRNTLLENRYRKYRAIGRPDRKENETDERSETR